MLQCCWHMSRDVVRAVAFVALLVGSGATWAAARVLQPAWAADPDVHILTKAWFPCGELAAAALIATLGAVVTLGSTCRRNATAPLHLFTGALVVLLPLEMALAAAVAADADVLRQLAAADATGALSAILDWVVANSGPAGAAAGTWLALQAAALVAGLWVALCTPRERKGPPRSYSGAPFYQTFDPEIAAGGSVHAPLLGGGRGARAGHQRRGSHSSAGGLTPRSPLGEGALAPAGTQHQHQGPQIPVIVLPTTGLT